MYSYQGYYTKSTLVVIQLLLKTLGRKGFNICCNHMSQQGCCPSDCNLPKVPLWPSSATMFECFFHWPVFEGGQCTAAICSDLAMSKIQDFKSTWRQEVVVTWVCLIHLAPNLTHQFKVPSWRHLLGIKTSYSLCHQLATESKHYWKSALLFSGIFHGVGVRRALSVSLAVLLIISALFHYRSIL